MKETKWNHKNYSLPKTSGKKGNEKNMEQNEKKMAG